MSTLRILALTYFSQPRSDRPIYRLMRQLRPRRIVTLGLGDGQRVEKMIRLASNFGAVHFVGVDMFEASPPGVPHMTLKSAHQRLSRLANETRLIPGDAGSALTQRANELMNTDLVIISATQTIDSVARAQAYLPRMLHVNSRVMLETQTPTGPDWQILSADDVSALSLESATSHRRTAA